VDILETLVKIRRKLLIVIGVLLVLLVVVVIAAGLFLWATAPRDTTQIIKNRMGMEFVAVPAGSFLMGSEKGNPDEKPVHQVMISKGFLLGRYEVTQGQWKDVMGRDAANFKGSNFPVQFLSWNDAQQFIARLNQTNDGYTYRLPTEAEWEYACRAGTTTEYADNLEWLAWYSGNSTQRVHPVGHLHPNVWGLYDMHGNLSEYCQDWYDPNYYGASPATDPPGPGAGKERVVRGGSFFDSGPISPTTDISNLRSAARSEAFPDASIEDRGLRLVAVPRPH
jgi:formylglycine-generating enzyme required for sulfatase activity